MAWLLAAATQASAERVVVHECNFNDGIPAEYATYDVDGQTPHFTMVQIGFDQGVAWTTMRERTNKDNRYAASTSKHKVVDGTTLNAEDWLVTPLMRIPSADATLAWRAQSVCESSQQGDTYEVYVSTTGNRPEDFVGGRLTSISGELVNQWAAHEVSLGAYAGKDVYIAFVNRSFLCEVLAIDDVSITSSPGFCEVVEEDYSYSYGTENVQPFGVLLSHSEAPITSFTAYCEVGDKVLQRNYEGVSIAAGEQFRFEFEEALPVAYGDTLQCRIWASVDGRTTGSVRTRIVSMLFEPQQTTVFEEGTGMWCGYCPLGIVAMNRLKEKYPDQFIGIALHYDDVLVVPGYSDAMYFDSFPIAWINRKYQTPPMVLVETANGMDYTMLNGGFETALLQQQAQKTIADITPVATFAEGKVHVDARVRFAVHPHDANYRLAYVVVEDRVEGEGYYQYNYFGGDDAYQLDGFEKADRVVRPYVFDDVARSIAGHREGIPGSVPTDIVCGEVYEHSYSFEVNNVNNPANAHVVAMLIDARTGFVVNAAKTGSLVTGIQAPQLDSENATPKTYDLSGRRVERPTRGIYIVDGKKIYVK